VIEAAVREAIAEMRWLDGADGATIEVALTLARQMDAEIADGDAVSLNVSRLTPHLLSALRTLTERRPPAAAVPRRLAELRGARRAAS
jgi:hypothetical protein